MKCSEGSAVIDQYNIVMRADGLEECKAGCGPGDALAGTTAECENRLRFFGIEGREGDDVQADFAAGFAVAIFPDRVGGAEGSFGYAGDGGIGGGECGDAFSRLPPAARMLQSSFMFRGLEHTAIASPDPARLAEWYVQKLDFRINYTYDGNYFVRASDGSMLEIIPSQGERAPQQMKDPGIRHLAVSVDNFDAALGELRNRGVQFLTEPFANQGNRLVFFSDGDGNILHLIQRERPLP
jgi:glyoxylase I family protein